MPRVSSRFFMLSPDRMRRVPRPSAELVQQMRADALEMTVFDVGVGETILLRRHLLAVLVDGGSAVKKRNEELGDALKKYIMGEALKLSGIVASHPHVDHLNAISTLLTNDGSSILADEVTYFDNGESMGTWLTETLGVTLADLGDAIEVVHVGFSGAQFALSNDVRIALFVDGRWRPRPAYRSVFMSLDFRHARFLLTGDAYHEYENSLLNSLAAAYLRCDVLKITHHGSEHGTSKAFADWASPRISVASTHDDEGHRLETVVEKRLSALGQVYDTHTTGGDIVVRTDGVWRTLGRHAGVLYEVEAVRPGRLTPV